MEQLAMTYEPELTSDEAAVWSVIRNRKGRAAAIPMPDLALLVFGSKHSTRRVQTIIVNLIEERNLPIGSSCKKPNGYYMLTTLEEYIETDAQLEHRMMSTSKRRAALRRCCPELAGQIKL